MKRKKRRTFRKPKPLFHLTTKRKLIIGTYLFVIRLHQVFNCVSKQIQLLHLCLRSFFITSTASPWIMWLLNALQQLLAKCPGASMANLILIPFQDWYWYHVLPHHVRQQASLSRLEGGTYSKNCWWYWWFCPQDCWYRNFHLQHCGWHRQSLHCQNPK